MKAQNSKMTLKPLFGAMLGTEELIRFIEVYKQKIYLHNFKNAIFHVKFHEELKFFIESGLRAKSLLKNC